MAKANKPETDVLSELIVAAKRYSAALEKFQVARQAGRLTAGQKHQLQLISVCFADEEAMPTDDEMEESEGRM